MSSPDTGVRPRKGPSGASESGPVAQGVECVTTFGWCLKGVGDAHADCRVAYFSEFDQRQHICGCACHGKVQS
jgi:hypothetical protein